jgi:hypothetical protein
LDLMVQIRLIKTWGTFCLLRWRQFLEVKGEPLESVLSKGVVVGGIFN